MVTLTLGTKGKEVIELQKKLNLIADGIFGKITEEAVKKFQADNHIKVDGIVGPQTWKLLDSLKAKPVSSVPGLIKSNRNIDLIIVHCTASAYGKNLSVEDIRKMHTLPVSKGGRGWSDIGYHYVVTLDGKIHNGRNVNLIGAHVSGKNTNSIGVVYVGGLDAKGKACDTRTPAQKQGLISLLTSLKKLYPHATIHGHNEFAAKACPCFNAFTEYRSL